MTSDINEPSVAIAATNMATTPTLNILLERLVPDTFKRGDDLEEFISACQRLFDALKLGVKDREIYVGTLIHNNNIKEYEATGGKVKGFEARLQLAFSKPKTVINEWEESLRYRKGGDSADVFIQKIEKMVEKIMEQKLEKEELTKIFLLHCADTKELKREILLKKNDDTESIKAAIRLADKVEEETEMVNTVQSYRDAAGNTRNQTRKVMTSSNRPYYKQGIRESGSNNRRDMECWTCHTKGHLSRDCPRRRPTCYACETHGHIRRNCHKVKCSRCLHNGHRTEECYTRLDRHNTRRNQDYGRRDYQRGIRNVNAISNQNEDCTKTGENFQGDKGRRNNRYEISYQNHEYEDPYSNEIERRYPNERAPSEVEVIGAME